MNVVIVVRCSGQRNSGLCSTVTHKVILIALKSITLIVNTAQPSAYFFYFLFFYVCYKPTVHSVSCNRQWSHEWGVFRLAVFVCYKKCVCVCVCVCVKVKVDVSPGLPSQINLRVSVDVKQHFNVCVVCVSCVCVCEGEKVNMVINVHRNRTRAY